MWKISVFPSPQYVFHAFVCACDCPSDIVAELRRQREAEERRRAELEEEEAERAQREADERAAAAVHASDSEEGRMLHRARLATRCVRGAVFYLHLALFEFRVSLETRPGIDSTDSS
jgi:hypothetical protein